MKKRSGSHRQKRKAQQNTKLRNKRMTNPLWISPQRLPNCCFVVLLGKGTGGLSDFYQEFSLAEIKNICRSGEHKAFYRQFKDPSDIIVTDGLNVGKRDIDQ
jgi:hypothetical protein